MQVLDVRSRPLHTVKGVSGRGQLFALGFGFHGRPAPPMSYRQSSTYINEEVSLADRNTSQADLAESGLPVDTSIAGSCRLALVSDLPQLKKMIRTPIKSARLIVVAGVLPKSEEAAAVPGKNASPHWISTGNLLTAG